jgi:hypothetical protein
MSDVDATPSGDAPSNDAETTPKLPTPYRNVINSIASTAHKREYQTKNNVDSPYRPHAPLADQPTSITTTTTDHQSTAPSSPSKACSSSTSTTLSDANADDNVSDNNNKTNNNNNNNTNNNTKFNGVVGTLRYYARRYEELLLEHTEMFSQIESIASSALFMMPGNMRDNTAEFGTFAYLLVTHAPSFVINGVFVVVVFLAYASIRLVSLLNDRLALRFAAKKPKSTPRGTSLNIATVIFNFD